MSGHQRLLLLLLPAPYISAHLLPTRVYKSLARCCRQRLGAVALSVAIATIARTLEPPAVCASILLIEITALIQL